LLPAAAAARESNVNILPSQKRFRMEENEKLLKMRLLCVFAKRTQQSIKVTLRTSKGYLA
jgi:hypothetical protein